MQHHVVANATTAYRIPAMAVAGVALWTTYLFGARAFGRRAGLVAAVLLGAMPHVFFHAHLACFDVPIMSMWIVCVYVHWRALAERTLWWALAAGVVFGLALETKHNAWVLPAVLAPHAIVVQGPEMWAALKRGRLALPWSLLSMAVVGPLVFLALWPYLWNDTVPRIRWWVEFHLNHEYYNIEFLGKNYFGPPSPIGYLPVLVFATVPTVTLLLFAIGAAHRALRDGQAFARWTRSFGEPAGGEPGVERGDPLHTDLLLFLSIAVSVGLFFLPRTPIFGGTKHWLPAYPALAIFAGHGFDLVAGAMRRALPDLDARRWFGAQAALFACVVLGPLAITAHSNPYGIAAYVPIVGGTAGGATMGLNRQFWGYTTEDAAEEYLNQKAPRGASVFMDDTTWDAWAHMQEEGHIRPDLHPVGAPHDGEFALVQHELHMNEVEYSIWTALGTVNPVYVVQHDGVPIVSIYRRP